MQIVLMVNSGRETYWLPGASTTWNIWNP